jgi:lipid-binding SYLF domain-containing protein
LFPLFLLLAFSPASADKFSDTQRIFENAGIGDLFKSAHGYALFPTIGKAGFVVGGAYGEGRVYKQGAHIGDTEMTQQTAGVQLGASGFSQVIFFEDEAALAKFTSGKFEFGVKVQAVALTASAEASANTAGNAATASGTKASRLKQASDLPGRSPRSERS